MSDIEKKISEGLPQVARALETLLRVVADAPGRIPFVLLAGHETSVQYVANVARQDGVRMISNLLERWRTDATVDLADGQAADFVVHLLAQCRAYHDALDRCFALLIEVTRGAPSEPFFPSKSPMWSAIASGKTLIDEVENAIALSKELSRVGAFDEPPPGERH